MPIFDFSTGTGSSSSPELLWNNSGSVDGFGAWRSAESTLELASPSSLVIGNTVAGLGGTPMPGSLLVGSDTYADGDASGDPVIQFEHTFTNPAQFTAFESNFIFNTGADMTDLISMSWASYFNGTHDYLGGVFPGATVNLAIYANANTTGAIQDLWNVYFGSGLNASQVGDYVQNWLAKPTLANGAAIDNLFGLYAADFASGASSNIYYLWLDSRGVYRIREDNVADGSGNPQAIPSLYNPRFTKYTPGATNFERSVEQWVGNVLQMGTEAGGTGTLRGVQIIGASLVTPAVLTNLNAGIGATSSDGIVLSNTTAAAAGAQQWSPRLHFIGQGWKTNATAASQTVDWIMEVVPVQAAAAPTANLVMSSQINGGGYTARATLTSAGQLVLGDGSTTVPALRGGDDNSGIFFTGNNTRITVDGTTVIGFAANPGVRVIDTLAITDSTQSADTGPSLVADGAYILGLYRAANAHKFRWYHTRTDASNYERGALQTAAGQVIIAAETAGTGTDDIDVTLTPAGAGLVRFGAHSAVGSETISGFITVKDSAGNTRKLAVIS